MPSFKHQKLETISIVYDCGALQSKITDQACISNNFPKRVCICWKLNWLKLIGAIDGGSFILASFQNQTSLSRFLRHAGPCVIGGSSLARPISITSHFSTWVVKEARVHTLTTTLVYYGSFCFGQPPTFLLKGHHEKRTAVNDRGKAAEYSGSEALLWNKLCFGLFQYSSI